MARLVPIWMKIEPIRAAANAPQRKSSPASAAAALPTSTGAIAAGRVRGRAAITQMRMPDTSQLRFRGVGVPQGRFGYFEKSGASPRFHESRPSWPSSVM